MARVVGVARAGPRSYECQVQDFPFVNASGQKDIGPEQIEASVRALWRAWIVVLVGAVLIAML